MTGINRVAKGDELVRRVADLLRKDGYKVHVVRKVRIRKRTGWISLGEDIWGAFDLAATRRDHIRFVQVTVASGGKAAERKRKIDALSLPDDGGNLYEVWTWHERRGWLVWRLGKALKKQIKPTWGRMPYPPTADIGPTPSGSIIRSVSNRPLPPPPPPTRG